MTQEKQARSGTVVDIESSAGLADSSAVNIRKMTELAPILPADLDHFKIVHPGTPNAKLLNAFRELRTKLIQKDPAKNFIVLVSSPVVGGGTSFVTLNLAASFALDQAKTALVIDCNLQNPSLHKLIPGEAVYGLTDYLVDDSLGIEDIIYATGIDRLRVVTMGKRKAKTEYFTSRRMQVFVNAVREQYPDRYIFLDAPSTSVTADVRILVDYCDYALLVAPYGGVSEAQIMACADALTEEKLAGIIFNN